MKRISFIICAAMLGAGAISCKSPEEETAQKAIDRYVIFVDSVNDAKTDKRAQRWQFIEEEYKRKRNDAEAGLLVLEGKDMEKEQQRVEESSHKYEGIKAVVEK